MTDNSGKNQSFQFVSDGGKSNGDSLEGNIEDYLLSDNTLEHALLESIFYNEMIAMENMNSGFGLFPADPIISLDSTLEDEIASGITLASSSAPPPPPADSSSNVSTNMIHGISSTYTSSNKNSNINSYRNNASTTNPQQPYDSLWLPSSHVSTLPLETTTTSSVASAHMTTACPNMYNNVTTANNSTINGATTNMNMIHDNVNHNGNIGNTLNPIHVPPPHLNPSNASLMAISSDIQTSIASANAVSQSQLIHQFQSLASRFGITLPPQVLSEITKAAATRASSLSPSSCSTSPSLLTKKLQGGLKNQPTLHPNSQPIPIITPISTTNIPQNIKQSHEAAEAAIAAVESSRKSGVGGEVAAEPIKLITGKRKRKATMPESEEKLQQLKAENEMLRRQWDRRMNKEAQFEEERKKSEKKLKDFLKYCNETNKDDDLKSDPSYDGDLSRQEEAKAILNQFSEMYSDYGQYRQEELIFHLNQLETLAAPTAFTKMSLWTLGQNKSFYTHPKHNPIAGILQQELDITPTQARKIFAHRERIQKLISNMKEVPKLISELKTLCQKKQRLFHDRMTKCQQILTPEQVVKLLVWVDENSSTLEHICPGWGSERMLGRKTDEQSVKDKSDPTKT